MTEVSDPHSSHQRNPLKTLFSYFVAVFFFTVFCFLGTWQVVRLDEKVELIKRVESRVHVEPIEAPLFTSWSLVTPKTHEYLSVKVQGELMVQYTTRVQASTVLGVGNWLMTPLLRKNGEIIWINRGYIPADESDPMTLENTQGQFEVRGLLRLSELGGGFLRKNEPLNNRWYSRDIEALSKYHHLKFTAPYFIDAGRPRNLAAEFTDLRPKSYPVDGLTVIKFHNSHLVYAITWYILAMMVFGVTVWLNRKSGSR
jgi:surfeit locus 1 family protein